MATITSGRSSAISWRRLRPGSDSQPTVLRAVPRQSHQLAQLPFILFIAVLLGGGLTGVLVLSTTIQTQSGELAALQSQEAELRYQEAALVAQAQDLRSSQNLADQAWALGMRPNPNPAFIKMPSGEILGVPTEVSGNELPGMVPPAPVSVPVTTPAPEPTEPGKNGNPRLSPAFVEWLMGIPAGHVTDVGLTRNEQLKALGNGVVPQQAAAATGAFIHDITQERAA